MSSTGSNILLPKNIDASKATLSDNHKRLDSGAKFVHINYDGSKFIFQTPEMNIPFDKNKLATDISYNIKLGSFYIKKLIDRFEGSEILAIASYNAGPNATQRWINEFYDPRSQNDIDKVVDWIELITYSETRNYVQRIMENLIVYKYLMAKSNYDKIN